MPRWVPPLRVLLSKVTNAIKSQRFDSLRPIDVYMRLVSYAIIGSDNGLSPGRRQAILWPNAGILLFGPFGTNFSGILIGIQTFSLRKMYLKISFAKWHSFCLGLILLGKSFQSVNSGQSTMSVTLLRLFRNCSVQLIRLHILSNHDKWSVSTCFIIYFEYG